MFNKTHFDFFFIFAFLYLLEEEEETGMPQHTRESQQKNCKSWLSPFTLWVPGIELRPSGIVASAFSC